MRAAIASKWFGRRPIDRSGRPALPLEPRRFQFIDALRGLASLAVMLFHFYFSGNLNDALAGITPSWLLGCLLEGRRGVDVFFVISGFVMAFSQRTAHVDGRYLLSFGVRRSLRLDPPYWLTLALCLILAHNRQTFLGHGNLLANLFYAQTLLNRPIILLTAWTLCYEVQFYLVLTLLNGFAQRLGARWGDKSALGWQSAGMAVAFVPVTVYSLAVAGGLAPNPLEGLFIDRWYLFAAGAFVWWALDGKISRWWVWAMLGAVGVFGVGRQDLSAGVGAVTALTVYAVGRRGRLYDLLGWKPLQFLGMISYSLYLLHPVVGLKVERFGSRFVGHSSLAALAWMGAATLFSVAAATGMYYLVERPGVWAGKRLKGMAERRSAGGKRLELAESIPAMGPMAEGSAPEG
jgi:peptidoglycan/LPS O-acetylase OafA/YrhL